ncbi:tRNA adenine-58-N1-methyltransferase non-catalytic subunit [Nymphaea thermarum]|nr:tRNA adenine-58-N1-methyltransferase non-catalytic subunit [Nymphaea thermarum]
MAEDAPQQRDPRIAWEGCSVLLDINDGDRLVFARLSPSSTLKIGNKKCSLGPLIGCPFGSLFRLEVGASGAFLSRDSSSSAGSQLQEKSNLLLNNETRDNRSLVDNNKAQALSGEDIDALRREGATGDQIIEALIANSSTFGKKTAFSQEKYKVRKQKKYAPKVLMRRPFTRRFLRMDTLSLLLSMANITAYSDVLVVDMVGGVVTGAVAERLSGTGSICSTYYGTKPYPMDIIGIFNFDCEIWSRIFCVAASDFCLAQEMNFQNSGSASNRKPPSSVSDVDNGVLDLVASDDSTSTPTSENVIQQDSSMKSDNHNEGLADEKSVNLNGILGTNVSTDDGFEGIDCKNIRTPNGAKYGRHPSLAYIDLWKQNGFSSLIMAAPDLDPWNIVQELLPLLSYSAPFAIYHQYLQVLPSRTHPAMQMSAFGGYILSGTRICRDNICLDNC